jgi:hypothetical protein
MSDVITLDQAVDFTHGTLQHFVSKTPAYTYLYSTYRFFNNFWKAAKKFTGGKYLEDHVVLGDEGNAKHSGLWDEDTHNVSNIEKKYRTDLVHSTTNFSYNLIENDLNKGGLEKIFDVVGMKYDNMCREWADDIFGRIFLTPESSDDVLNPVGISGWLPLGTDNSTGGWTGYTADYGDGNAFNVGGLTSSAATNARWASYYADHNGNIDDSLFLILFKAMSRLNFMGPQVPKMLDLNTAGYSPRFSMYTSLNLQAQVAQLYAKADDQMGFRPQVHYGVPHFMNIPLEYVPILDTADTTRYGTDPIFGINHQLIFPLVQSSWNFKISKPVSRAAGGQHLVMTVYGDLEYAIHGRQRRHAGFLISQQ